jgi:hypothetical protein
MPDFVADTTTVSERFATLTVTGGTVTLSPAAVIPSLTARENPTSDTVTVYLPLATFENV